MPMAPKSTKPRDRSAPKGPSLSKVKDALRALINRPGTQAETPAYIEEVHTGFGGRGVGAGGNRNDRGAALLLTSNLENSLRIAIERKLGITEKRRAMLFVDEAAPLRDFSAKVRIGYAVGLFGEDTKNNLDIIRLIRNAFAHAPSPVRFSTLEVRNACALLKIPAPVGKADDQKDTTTGRVRFRLVCERTATAFRYVPPKSTTY